MSKYKTQEIIKIINFINLIYNFREFKMDEHRFDQSINFYKETQLYYNSFLEKNKELQKYFYTNLYDFKAIWMLDEKILKKLNSTKYKDIENSPYFDFIKQFLDR